MRSDDLLKRVPLLLHFTDRQNIPLIRQIGGLCGFRVRALNSLLAPYRAQYKRLRTS